MARPGERHHAGIPVSVTSGGGFNFLFLSIMLTDPWYTTRVERDDVVNF